MTLARIGQGALAAAARQRIWSPRQPVLAAGSLRSYASGPTRNTQQRKAPTSSSGSPSVEDAQEMGAMTSAADLHPLPSSVKGAAAPPRTGGPQLSASGNSTAPEDLSSRPAAPGPSAPITDASVAAPHLARNGGNGNSFASSSDDSFKHDWATSFQGMSTQPFPREVAEILEAPINEEDVEIKPDGLLYLPEIKYRRILNRAFGPGGWGLAPRGETNVGDKIVSREWALVCLGRFVSTARGEQEYFDPSGVATASEAAKSNALMRCCKDLGIAHELWSPRYIRNFKDRMCVEVFVENTKTKTKRKLWRRKDGPKFEYPWKET